MVNRLDLLLEYLQNEPHDEFLNYALAMEFQKNNQLKEAIEQLEKLKEINSDYLATYYSLGKLYESIDNNDSAIINYKKGVELAKQQNNKKTLGELNEALMLLDTDE